MVDSGLFESTFPILQVTILFSALTRMFPKPTFTTKNFPSHTIRNYIYKNILSVTMPSNAVIYFNTEIRASWNLEIGNGSIIGDSCILDARNKIIIGNNVNISSEVRIWTEQHDYQDPMFNCNSTPDFQVIIKDYAWIGSNVIILPKVTIGKGAVVAAGSVVTKSVPDYTLVAGIPAKKLERETRIYNINSMGHIPIYYKIRQ